MRCCNYALVSSDLTPAIVSFLCQLSFPINISFIKKKMESSLLLLKLLLSVHIIPNKFLLQFFSLPICSLYSEFNICIYHLLSNNKAIHSSLFDSTDDMELVLFHQKLIRIFVIYNAAR
jgi:hypothetical protein